MGRTTLPEGIDPDRIATRQEFAAALTAVREAAGLTVREVARSARISPSTVGGYFSGRHLPPLRPDGGIRAILVACAVSEPTQIEAWQRALQRVRRAPGPRPGALPAPYRGLAAYRAEDADLFFGRDADVERLAALLADPPASPRLWVLLGRAGTGKSSLVQAGLIPRLRAAGHPVTVIKPGGVRVRIMPEARPSGGDPNGAGPVVVIDPFEDVLAEVPDPDRAGFVRELAASTEPSPTSEACAVLIVLGSDALPEATGFPEVKAAVEERAMVLGALPAETVRAMVLGPARRSGVDVEDDLVEAVLADVADLNERATPVLSRLSHALLTTWRNGRRGQMSLSAYRASGGLLRSIEVAAESVYQTLPDTARTLVPGLLAGELTGASGDASSDADLRAAIRAFAEVGLLDPSDTEPPRPPAALVAGWPRLRGWWAEQAPQVRSEHVEVETTLETPPTQADSPMATVTPAQTSQPWPRVMLAVLVVLALLLPALAVLARALT